MQQAEAGQGTGGFARIVSFEYPASPHAPALPLWEGWTEMAEAAPADGNGHKPSGKATEALARAEFDKRLAEETRRSFEAGREQGRQEGRQSEREAQAGAAKAAESERVHRLADLMEGFVQERDRYLHAVEHEVVRLALAVAARILRREAQMDPLLLTGAVRVALGQLSASTAARLRVPPDELDLWTDAIALLPNLSLKPEVVAGEGMRLGDCAIETELGSVDLGIRSQLGEIERGFFDRAGAGRPKAAAGLARPDGSEDADRESRP